MASKKQYCKNTIKLADFAQALSHPVRVSIFKKLLIRDSYCCFDYLSKDLSIGRSTISQHLKVLKDKNLINDKKEAPYVRYCINRENWVKIKNSFQDYFKDMINLEQDCSQNK